MKKVLFLSAILALSTTLFAGETDRSCYDPCAETVRLPVRAEVCWPLQVIRAKGLNFGVIRGGEPAVLPALSPGGGLIVLTGQRDKNILVDIDEQVYLDGPDSYKLLVTPIFVREDIIPVKFHDSDFVMQINDFGYGGYDFLGKEILKVGGRIPAQNVKPGEYTGFTYVTFTYQN